MSQTCNHNDIRSQARAPGRPQHPASLYRVPPLNPSLKEQEHVDYSPAHLSREAAGLLEESDHEYPSSWDHARAPPNQQILWCSTQLAPEEVGAAASPCCHLHRPREERARYDPHHDELKVEGDKVMKCIRESPCPPRTRVSCTRASLGGSRAPRRGPHLFGVVLVRSAVQFSQACRCEHPHQPRAPRTGRTALNKTMPRHTAVGAHIRCEPGAWTGRDPPRSPTLVIPCSQP